MGSVSEWITVDNHSHCNEVKLKANRRDDTSQTAFAGSERDARVQQRRERLSGNCDIEEKKKAAIHRTISCFQCSKRTG